MATIEFNQEKKNINTQSIRTVAELIPSIKSNYLSKNEYLSRLFINGEEVNSKNQSLFLQKDLEEKDLVQFKVANSKNILLETIDELPEYIDSLIQRIELAVELSNKQELALAEGVLTEIVGKIDAFIQLITEVHRSLIILSEQKLESGKTIKELEIHLLSITKALLVARKRKDLVMLIDLLDYELKDNLTQWKITVMPQIRRLNTI